MSKLKKVLLMCTAYVLVAALAIGGTLAYLTSTDEDVNVMTMGNVKIEQIEQQRVDDKDNQTKLEKFKNDKPLYPAVFAGSSISWAPEDEWVVAGEQAWKVVEDNTNVVDKFVTVKNTGKSDAFVRTLIAYEGDDEYGPNGAYIHIVTNGSNVEPKISNNFVGYINIDGVDYTVFEYVYPEVLAAGETTIPSLKQVYMNKAADNDVVAYYGETYDIVVLSQAVQANGFADAKTALDDGFGKSFEKAVEWFGGIIPDLWDASADFARFGLARNATDEEIANATLSDNTYVIKTAEELAAFAELVDAGHTFEGKTVKLGRNINLEDIVFDPIGSYKFDKSFKGTFDGDNYTIFNLSQNTWALNNGYYYNDCGLGLFGAIENGTVKNLTIDGADISGESAICGTIAAVADNAVFENITVKNANVADYQYYSGGIVGWASGNHTYKNINMDASTIIGSQWGDFGNANGGIIGGIGTSGNYHFEDCTVACRIDATNDVVSAYQWYNYRNSGMLIGRVPQTITNGEVQTVATPNNVTCKNVSVIYGDWANYTYCEFAGTGYPYVRVQAGVSVDAYSNVRYGHPTDANGNTVVDDNHVHNDGEAHHELIAFDQLFGGPANHRYCYYGINAFDGVNVVYNNK